MNHKYKYLLKQNDITGIYKITFKPTNQYYIGKSISIIQSRWPKHSVDLRTNKHSCKELQRLYNINTNIEDFSFEILEECNKDISAQDLYLRELFFWKEAGELAINQEPKLNGVAKHSDKTKKKMSENMKGNKNNDQNKDSKSKEYMNEYNKQYRQANKEKIKEYRQNNKEYQNEYRQANKQKISEKMKQYYLRKKLEKVSNK